MPQTLMPAKDILLEMFGGCELKLAASLVNHTWFISPDRVKNRLEKTKSAAWFPKHVRESNQYHPGKHKGDTSAWENREVTVCDNTKARLAFAKFSGLAMAGNVEDRVRGYHVAHIWERVYDPECFTAGWNLCLMPGFLKLFTEEQDRIPLLHQAIQQCAFDIYFKYRSIGLERPSFITPPGLELSNIFPSMTPNLLN